MEKVNIFLLLFASFGLSYIIQFSKILQIPRNFITKKSNFISEMLKCVFCTNFWCGVFLCIVLFYYLSFPELILTPLAATGFGGILGLLVDRLELG